MKISIYATTPHMELLQAHKARQLQSTQWHQSLSSVYPAFQIIYVAQKQALVDYKYKANYWQARFEHLKTNEAALKAQVEDLKAQLRKREQQLFGRKSEKNGKTVDGVPNLSNTSALKRNRGQQSGSSGHGRRDYSHLPQIEETHALTAQEAQCATCGLPFAQLSITETSEIVELINVNAYVRKISRKKYQRQCHCANTPKFTDAPPAQQLLPKSRFGISVWAYLLLQKYEYQHPLNRTLKQLAAQNLPLSAGTLADGFRRLMPLFEPVYDAIVARNPSSDHWHADETAGKFFKKLKVRKIIAGSCGFSKPKILLSIKFAQVAPLRF